MKSIEDIITEGSSSKECELYVKTGLEGGPGDVKPALKFKWDNDAYYLMIARDRRYINILNHEDVRELDDVNGMDGKLDEAISQLERWQVLDDKKLDPENVYIAIYE